MKKLFLAFMLLAPVAMAYGERNEIIVSPTYVNQKKENGSKVGKYALGNGVNNINTKNNFFIKYSFNKFFIQYIF